MVDYKKVMNVAMWTKIKIFDGKAMAYQKDQFSQERNHIFKAW